ncbi:MAG: lipase, partial [Clostridia bacterium]|nr:lipase [Clostridia bacterium]
MEFKNNYPCVFIHGLMGYGEQDFMDVVFPNFGLFNHTFFKHLKARGIETYNPSLGPMNSAWDRACILWAYLFGGRVDYGKAHSEKYGHARYGKEYPGVLKDLGQTEAHKKMNLIGHSFGGPTVKTVAWLFAFGSEEERADTPAEELSPLFAGGHGNLLHTVTTLSGVNNGTALASFFGNKGMSVADYA